MQEGVGNFGSGSWAMNQGGEDSDKGILCKGFVMLKLRIY